MYLRRCSLFSRQFLLSLLIMGLSFSPVQAYFSNAVDGVMQCHTTDATPDCCEQHASPISNLPSCHDVGESCQQCSQCAQCSMNALPSLFALQNVSFSADFHRHLLPSVPVFRAEFVYRPPII